MLRPMHCQAQGWTDLRLGSSWRWHQGAMRTQSAKAITTGDNSAFLLPCPFPPSVLRLSSSASCNWDSPASSVNRVANQSNCRAWPERQLRSASSQHVSHPGAWGTPAARENARIIEASVAPWESLCRARQRKEHEETRGTGHESRSMP